MRFEPVIGLEIHVELSTKAKVFCSCDAGFGGEPNTHVCPVCLGMPGTLPVLNEGSLEYALMTALALNCQTPAYFEFDRKHYYYPDLPKNYQISQEYIPLGKNGYLDILLPDGSEKRVRIHNVHLEEDAGKLLHEGQGGSLVDLNRAGCSLLEIVSEPDMRTIEEMDAYMKSMRALLRYCGVSDCKIQEGSLRFEVNLSLRPLGSETYGTKVECKNIGSMKAAVRAAQYEIERQADILRSGGVVAQETRMWDDDRGRTFSMRGKEGAKDYRYFPDPDLPPVEVSVEYLQALRAKIPELPLERRKRLIDQYQIPPYDAGVLVADRDVADYFEQAVRAHNNPKAISNWVMTRGLEQLKTEDDSILDLAVQPLQLAELVAMIDDGTISHSIAQRVFTMALETGDSPRAIVEREGLMQVTDVSVIERYVDQAIAENPGPANDVRNGKEKALGRLMGAAMKLSGGKANPGQVQELLRAKLLGGS